MRGCNSHRDLKEAQALAGGQNRYLNEVKSSYAYAWVQFPPWSPMKKKLAKILSFFLLGLLTVLIFAFYGKTRLPFSSKNKWLPYQAQCPGLALISFERPENWPMGEDAEEPAADGGEGATKTCFISFGYPESPWSRQDPWSPGLYGLITLEAWPSSSAGNSLRASLINLGHGIKEEEINGRKFLTTEDEYGEGVKKKIYGITVEKYDYYFSFQIAYNRYTGVLNKKMAAYLAQTQAEFLKRIKFER